MRCIDIFQSSLTHIIPYFTRKKLNFNGTLTKYHARTLTYVILLKKKKNLCDSNYAISIIYELEHEKSSKKNNF